MPSGYDSVLPMAMETPVEGGTQVRTSPTELDPTQDAPAVAGVHLVGPGAAKTDKTVYVDRSGTSLRMTDQAVSRLLSDLMTYTDGATQSHSASRDLAHYLADQGPGPGFASGAYCSLAYNGPLLTSATWYTSSAMSTKIVARVLSYPSGSVLPSSETWTVYSSTGAAIRTLTDTYTYSGPLVTAVTRTWS